MLSKNKSLPVSLYGYAAVLWAALGVRLYVCTTECEFLIENKGVEKPKPVRTFHTAEATGLMPIFGLKSRSSRHRM